MSYTSFICKNNQATENCSQSLKSEISFLFKAPKEAYTFFKVNNRVYQSNLFLLEADVAIKEVRKLWWLMEHSALKDDVFPLDKDKTRQQVVDTIALLRNSNQHNVTKYVNLLNSSINSWSDLEEKYMIKLSGSEVSDSLSPLHHYFHMYLNVSWLLLTLRLYNEDAVEQNMRDIIKDLVALSNVHFNKDKQSDVLQKNAFVCPCVKQLWILLQLFWECVNSREGGQKTFWDLFNGALAGYDDVFGLWLLSHIATIQVSHCGGYCGK